MNIIKVRRIAKRPYVDCQACHEAKVTPSLAPNEITVLGMRYDSFWLCDEHLIQLKQEVASIQVGGGN